MGPRDQERVGDTYNNVYCMFTLFNRFESSIQHDLLKEHSDVEGGTTTQTSDMQLGVHRCFFFMRQKTKTGLSEATQAALIKRYEVLFLDIHYN